MCQVQQRGASVFPGHGGSVTIVVLDIPVAILPVNIWRKKEEKRGNGGGSMRNGAIVISLGPSCSAKILPVTSRHNNCISAQLQSHYYRCRSQQCGVYQSCQCWCASCRACLRVDLRQLPVFFLRRFIRFRLKVNISACNHANAINCDDVEGWPRVPTDGTCHHRENGSNTCGDTST